MSSSKHSGVLADNAARPMRPDTIYFHCNLWSNIRYNGLPYPCYLPSKMSDDLIYIGNADAVGSCAVHCASSMLRQYGPKGSRVGKRRWLLSWDQLAGKGRGALVGSETFRTSRAWSSILRPDESTNDVTQHFAFATTAAVLKAVWRRHVVRTFSGDDEGEFDRMKSRSKTMIEEMRQLRSYATSVSLYALRDLIVTDATMCGVFEAQTANTPLLLPPQLLAFRVATFVKTHLKSILLILEESVVACCGGLAENAVSEAEETSRKIIKETQKREARILSRLALDLPRIQTQFSSVGSSLLPASPEGKDPLLPSCPSLLQSSKGCKSKLLRVEMAVRLRAWRVIVLMRSQAHDFARETRCDAKMEHDFAANAPDLALLVSEILFVAARAVVQKRCSIFRWIEAMYLMLMNRGKKRTKENDTRRRRLRCAKCKQIGGLDIGSPHFAGQEKDDGRVEKRNIVPFDVSSGQETKRVTFGGRRSALKSLLGDFISRYRNVAAFINHTCTQANVEARYVWSDHLDNALPRVVFYAKRTIKAGDELLVHYGFKLDNCACATCSPVIENLTIEEKRRQVREVALRTVGESIGHRVKRSATEAYRFRVEIRRDEEHWEFLLRDSIRDLVDYVRRDSDMLQVIREATDHFDAVLSSYKINTTSTVTHGGMRGPSMIEKRRRVRDACLRVLCKSSKYRVDWTFRRKLKRGRYGDAGSKQFRLLAKSGSELLGDDDDEKDAVEMYTLVARSVPELVDLVCRNEEDTRAVCKETEFFDEVRTYLCGESSNESESSEEENEDRVTIPGKRRQVRDVILRILDGNDEHRVERDDISDGCQKFRLFRYRWNAHGEKTWRLVARSLPELINYVLRFNLITDTVRMSTDYFDDVRESFQQKAPKLSSEFVRATRAKISKVTDVKIKSENTAVPNVWSRFRRDVIKVLVDRCNHTVRYNGKHWYLYRKKTTTGKLVRVARSAPELANYVGSLHDVNLIRDLRRRVENLDELVRIARAKNKVARALARTASASGCP
eukprot:g1442.t1